jgi:diguanylate cyclase (GGDEF)-like protein
MLAMKTPRISMKMFRILGITVLLIIVANSLLNQHLTRRNVANQIYTNGVELIRPLQQTVRDVVAQSDSLVALRGLSTQCAQLKKTSADLLEIAILDSSGNVLAHNEPWQVGSKKKGMPVFRSAKRVFKESLTSLDTYVPVTENSMKPLYIKTSYSKNLLVQQTSQPLLASLIFSTATMLLFLLVIFLFTNKLLGKRIAKILNAFEILSGGNLNVRLTESHGKAGFKTKDLDELDLLMESFDKMADRLRNMDNKRKEQEHQLGYLATHDPLTGLSNRRLLEHHLKKAVLQAKQGRKSAFVLMDLDNFKFVNDTLGHAVGDKVLVQLTEILKNQLRSSDLLARLGGDEFALLLEDKGDTDEAEIVAARMCQAVEEYRFTYGNNSFHLGLSIGIVMIDGKAEPGMLLSEADSAMYSAKKQGRNRVVVYSVGNNMLNQLSEIGEWAIRIKDALQDDNFILYYQPIYRLNDSRISHYEVLVRLMGPNGDVIAPQKFIPAAEQFGLMPQLDRWVVKHAIQTLYKYPDIHLYANISGHSLADPSFLSFIEENMLFYSIEPQRLGFEITESTVVEDFDRVKEWIERLKTFGCQFALDDFGTGFNSFLYLRNLPVDQLKLDGIFISTLAEDLTQRPLVQAMHQLARALGIETVAECVENKEVVKILQGIGVTYGQGFHLGKPAANISDPSLNPMRLAN